MSSHSCVNRENSSCNDAIRLYVFLLLERMRRTPSFSRGRKATPVVSGSSGSGAGRNPRMSGIASCLRRWTHHSNSTSSADGSGVSESSCLWSAASSGNTSAFTAFSKRSTIFSKLASSNGGPVYVELIAFDFWPLFIIVKKRKACGSMSQSTGSSC